MRRKLIFKCSTNKHSLSYPPNSVELIFKPPNGALLRDKGSNRSWGEKLMRELHSLKLESQTFISLALNYTNYTLNVITLLKHGAFFKVDSLLLHEKICCDTWWEECLAYDKPMTTHYYPLTKAFATCIFVHLFKILSFNERILKGDGFHTCIE